MRGRPPSQAALGKAKRLAGRLFYIALLLMSLELARSLSRPTNQYSDFLLLVGVLFATAYLAADKLIKGKRLRLFSVMCIVFLFISINCTEAILRYGSRSYQSYNELIGNAEYNHIYPTAIDRTKCKIYTSARSNSCSTASCVDYKYIQCFNSLGLRNKNISEKEDGEYRILAIGDSFTEGAGAIEDSTWPMVLQGILQKENSPAINVINAGVSGSYPVCEYLLLKEMSASLHPDMLILAINPTDINDFIINGGYQADDGSVFPVDIKPPDWEWLYGASFIVRHIVHRYLGYNMDLQKASTSKKLQLQGWACLHRSLLDIDGYCRNKHIKFMVLFHPSEGEIRNGVSIFRDLEEKLNGNIPYCDALDYYLAHAPAIRKDGSGYYWPHDQHHTPKGYRLLAEAAYNCLITSGLLTDSINCDQGGTP